MLEAIISVISTRGSVKSHCLPLVITNSEDIIHQSGFYKRLFYLDFESCHYFPGVETTL